MKVILVDVVFMFNEQKLERGEMVGSRTSKKSSLTFFSRLSNE
jgi:hypothetical protein